MLTLPSRISPRPIACVEYGYGRLDSAQVCHRPVALLNGVEDASCPAEPRTITRVKEPHLRWMTAHFVHIPKSGGSSFGRVIRRVMCAANAFSDALDCCIADETQWCAFVTRVHPSIIPT